MMEIEELDRQVLWHPFTQMAEWDPLVIERGEGCWLYDRHGRRYLDAISSLWCNVFGHRHPKLDAALAEQAHRIAHSTFLGLTHEPGILLAKELLAIAPKSLSRVFYSDSGSTAVEIALKQSFQYWQLTGQPEKQRFLRLGEAYHGDTLGAVGVGGIDLFHRIFGPLLVNSIAIPTPAGTDGSRSLALIESVLRSQSDDIAAFILEPLIQGAAGMLVHPPGFLSKVAELCRCHGVHLIVDEVATGLGRTGRAFACEHEGVDPDFLCLAKGISGGYLPLAATLATEQVYEAFLGKRTDLKHFFHGHTYTANPLACAVGRAALQLLPSALDNVQAQSGQLGRSLERVASHPLVKSIRRVGMMVGIELNRSVANEVCMAGRQHELILRPLGDVVVWMPPLIISTAELQHLEAGTWAALQQCFT